MQWLLVGSLVPKSKQFPLVLRRPFYNQPQHPGRKMTSDNHQRLYIYHGFVFAILRVKMRRRVLVEEHFDADAEEAADLRHVGASSLATSGRDLRVSYR